MDNYTARSEELFALRSIYEEKDLLIEEDGNRISGRLLATVHLPRPFFITRRKKARAVPESDSRESLLSTFRTIEVEYLPPINLLFELPDSYPAFNPPAFLVSCTWLSLSQISMLCRKLESLWKENKGEVVLFRWIQFLQEEVLKFLEITKSLDISKLSLYKRWKWTPPIQNKKNCSTKCGTSRPKDFVCNQTLFTPDSLDTSCNEFFSNSNVNLNNTGEIVSICSSADRIVVVSTAQRFCEKVKSRPTQALRPCVSGGSGPIDLRAVLDLTDGQMLLTLLEEFDKVKKLDSFQKQFFSCKVCYSEKPGSSFMQFKNCNHLYCRDCMRSYFETQIKDGNVYSLTCPEDKCHSQADAAQIKELVDAQLFLKYDEILLSRTLDSMADIAYCPRKHCQCALVTDSSTNMGTCPACSFVFCIFCKMAYHGIAACNFKSSEKREICKKYLSSDQEEKVKLEKMYGRKALQYLVDNSLSEDWIDSHSKKCPHCSACIEKTDGCNKMTCYRCNTYFCWLCMCRLKSSNPYDHFGNSDSPCFNQLFTGVTFDEEEEFLPGEFL